jgi:hypothetical protein
MDVTVDLAEIMGYLRGRFQGRGHTARTKEVESLLGKATAGAMHELLDILYRWGDDKHRNEVAMPIARYECSIPAMKQVLSIFGGIGASMEVVEDSIRFKPNLPTEARNAVIEFVRAHWARPKVISTRWGNRTTS